MTHQGDTITSLQSLVEKIVMCEECGENLVRTERAKRKLCKLCAQDYDDAEDGDSHHAQREVIAENLRGLL